MFLIFIPIIFIIQIITFQVNKTSNSSNQENIKLNDNSKFYSSDELKQILSVNSFKVFQKYFLTATSKEDIDFILQSIIGIPEEYQLLSIDEFKHIFVSDILKTDLAVLKSQSTIFNAVKDFMTLQKNFVNLDKFITLIKNNEFYEEFIEKMKEKSLVDFSILPFDVINKLVITKQGLVLKDINNTEQVKEQLYELIFEFILFDADQVFHQSKNKYYQEIFSVIFLEQTHLNVIFESYNEWIFKDINSKLLNNFLLTYNYKTINDFTTSDFMWIVKLLELKQTNLLPQVVKKLQQIAEKKFLLNISNPTNYLVDLPSLFVRKTSFQLYKHNLSNKNLYHYFDKYTEMEFEAKNKELYIKELQVINYKYLLIILSVVCFTSITLIIWMISIKYYFITKVSNKYTITDLLNDISKDVF